jgi:SAM-dependent methyltransferase
VSSILPNLEVQIDLGCGRTKAPGYIGLDIHPFSGVDLVCDLEQGIPLSDNCVHIVYANHTLEHIEHLDLLVREIYRVCRPGAAVIVRVPYYASVGAFKDPTQRRFFAEDTFRYFHPAYGARFDYGFGVHLEIERIAYTYSWPFARLGRVAPSRWLAPFRQFLWNVVHTMVVEMRVVK